MRSSSFRRVTSEWRCPVCGKGDWCLRDGDRAAICTRIPDGAVRRIGEAGWLHRFGPGDTWRRPAWTSVRVGSSPPTVDFAALAEQCRQAVEPSRLDCLASSLGLTTSSLCRLGVGWSATSRAWSFPMADSRGRILGIRLRSLSGRKFAVTGGHDGIFVPEGLDASGQLLIAEGPTDTAAILDLGFDAIGRPSCRGGSALLAELVRINRPEEVVIVADGDGPGQDGAQSLVPMVLPYCRRLRVLTPPTPIKDARGWKLAGADHEAVLEAIHATQPYRVRVHCQIARRSASRWGRRYGR